MILLGLETTYQALVRAGVREMNGFGVNNIIDEKKKIAGI
jgi:hypothetical protein